MTAAAAVAVASTPRNRGPYHRPLELMKALGAKLSVRAQGNVCPCLPAVRDRLQSSRSLEELCKGLLRPLSTRMTSTKVHVSNPSPTILAAKINVAPALSSRKAARRRADPLKRSERPWAAPSEPAMCSQVSFTHFNCVPAIKARIVQFP